MKTVLITGANRGIGLEHTRRYAERGARIFATARKPDEADELAALAKRHAEIKVLAYDASDNGAAAALKDRIGSAPLDLMFANAGAMGTRRQTFGDVDTEAVQALIQVNALAPLKLAEAVRRQRCAIRSESDGVSDQPYGLDRRQRLGRRLRLSPLQGDAEHDR